jgi:hypothetical protein
MDDLEKTLHYRASISRQYQQEKEKTSNPRREGDCFILRESSHAP